MARSLQTVEADASVREAARIMAVRSIGVLPVSSAGRLVGVVTDRDLTTRALARGVDAERTPVRAVMTRDAVTCFEADEAEVAAERMGQLAVRRLVVLGRDLEPVGLLSVDDLLLRPETRSLALAALARMVAVEIEHPAPIQ